MQESYGEGLATHTGLGSCGDVRKGGAEASTEVRAGQVFSRERTLLRGADALGISGRPHSTCRYRETRRDPARSETLCTLGNTNAWEPGGPGVVHGRWTRGPCREAARCTPMTYDSRRSDSSVVPMKSPNDANRLAEEATEGRGLTKGNSRQQKRAPDTEPDQRAQCVGASTASGKAG